ncbi:MAG: purine-nucleoside phosphorylase [Planctomycetota bacterium]|nr:purine-nucleoside phosphorylase [Planctomycetota bacterium]MCX8040665.1 purine-nucleoside phosphorylase [Planctomycetota bacterium]MDW8372808.1 purine-nucleoside phosphorylase [Planctomycetota bacterium]
MSNALAERLAMMAEAVRARAALRPRVAILLGTGMGALSERIAASARIPYAEIPGMPRPTAESHAGDLVLGELAGVPVAAFSGRLHAYEGHAPADIVMPVRLARALGAEILIMGSAVGGLNPLYAVGDLCVLEDHINLMGINPLAGPNDERVGPRWPDMYDAYDARLRALALQVARQQQRVLHRAVYVGVLGPNLETRAEYRFLRACGADVVGMSTVPETIAAVHCGLRVLAFAIVTDRCLPDCLEPVDAARIIAAARAAEPELAALVCGVLAALPPAAA